MRNPRRVPRPQSPPAPTRSPTRMGRRAGHRARAGQRRRLRPALLHRRHVSHPAVSGGGRRVAGQLRSAAGPDPRTGGHRVARVVLGRQRGTRSGAGGPAGSHPARFAGAAQPGAGARPPVRRAHHRGAARNGGDGRSAPGAAGCAGQRRADPVLRRVRLRHPPDDLLAAPAGKRRLPRRGRLRGPAVASPGRRRVARCRSERLAGAPPAAPVQPLAPAPAHLRRARRLRSRPAAPDPLLPG